MGKSLYTIVPVNMEEFLYGKNPTTQPGQVFDFYATMHDAINPSHMETKRKPKMYSTNTNNITKTQTSVFMTHLTSQHKRHG